MQTDVEAFGGPSLWDLPPGVGLPMGPPPVPVPTSGATHRRFDSGSQMSSATLDPQTEKTIRHRTPDFSVKVKVPGQKKFLPVAIFEIKRFRWKFVDGLALQDFLAKPNVNIGSVATVQQFDKIEAQMGDQASFAMQGTRLTAMKGIGIIGPFYRRFIWRKEGDGVRQGAYPTTRCIWRRGTTELSNKFLLSWEWVVGVPRSVESSGESDEPQAGASAP